MSRITFIPREPSKIFNKELMITIEGRAGTGKNSLSLLIAHLLRINGFRVEYLGSDELESEDEYKMLVEAVFNGQSLRDTHITIVDKQI